MGAIIGSYVGAMFFEEIDISYIPIILSLFILLVLWTPINTLIKMIPGRYFSLGIIQTGLSLYVGATGPLSTSILFKEGYKPNQVIVTNAAINTIINIAKIIVFSSLGFLFHEYLFHIVLMSVFAVIGSYLGTHYREKMNEKLAEIILKILITLLCIKNIIVYFLF